MIVVDTNILAYLWLPSSRQADAVKLGRLDPAWAAPLLWRSEFRNVATGFLRSGKFSRADALLATDRAARCLLAGEHAVHDAAIFNLVAQSKCSAYDCEFVALAQSLGTRLVTEDRALLLAFPGICQSLANIIGKAKP